jgi:hypothetical protein
MSRGRPGTFRLLEHDSAVPLREAVARAGGFRIADALISPVGSSS